MLVIIVKIGYMMNVFYFYINFINFKFFSKCLCYLYLIIDLIIIIILIIFFFLKLIYIPCQLKSPYEDLESFLHEEYINIHLNRKEIFERDFLVMRRFHASRHSEMIS
ncbi:hypothetical protein PORY_002148 [Pneumocystis oryctolagi]|uniref:Uncharacterized protein n=1 Tax=Pneumocystis oryctolagi TaxID=42067 RepID=A0ACB7CA57_9ASCO|nr:hypothetical protein PORY_002148 [Pneumocystis oryctolagi]